MFEAVKREYGFVQRGKNFKDWLRPLDFSYVPSYPHPFQGEIWSQHLPKFCGTPMVPKHIVSLMDFVVNLNIVGEDVLMMAFTLSLLGASP